MDFSETFSLIPQQAQATLSDPRFASRVTGHWVPIPSLGVYERIFVSFELSGTPSLAAEFDSLENNFSEPVVPFAADLGANFFCVQVDGSVTYFDFAGAYGPLAQEPDDEPLEPTAFFVAESLRQFLEVLHVDYRPHDETRAACLEHLRAHPQSQASMDECWIFQGSKAQLIKRRHFTTFREHFYHCES